jgi:hypothetical protein
MARSGEPPAPAETDAHMFAGVRVWLSYPYRVDDGVKHMEPKKVEDYWRTYFTQRGAADTDITIAPFGAGVSIPAPLSFE